MYGFIRPSLKALAIPVPTAIGSIVAPANPASPVAAVPIPNIEAPSATAPSPTLRIIEPPSTPAILPAPLPNAEPKASALNTLLARYQDANGIPMD